MDGTCEDAREEEMRVIIKERAKGLCGTCSNAIIVSGRNNENFLKCDAIYFSRNDGNEATIPFEVKECTKYHRAGTTNLQTMGTVAWILEIDKRKGTAGFVTAEDWEKSHPRKNPIPRHVDYD